MTKMIPPVPTSAVMMPTPKQKIGFSIESIVGNDAAPSTNSPNALLSKIESMPQQQNNLQSHLHHQRHDIQDILTRLHNSTNNMLIASHHNLSPPSVHSRLTPDDQSSPPLKRARSPSPQPLHSPPRQHSPQQQQPPSLCNMNKQSPIVVPGMPPGLIRPFPVPPPNLPDIKAIPPYIGSPEMVAPQHNPHLLAAAQFQMAAALQAGHVLGPGGMPPHAQFLPNPGMTRESYPLYPWLLTRHGRIFPHRFPGNFLLQPFRKPKRIRTAFSPSQLLKLEHAFESNQYVVGAERKALAQSLNLSETQVKVWFQNRRTKHKRMQQEDEKGSGNGKNSSSSDRNANGMSGDEDDDELIDMEMDDCPSEDEADGHQ